MSNWLTDEIKQEISESDTLLDLGCGLATPTKDLPNLKLCVDAHELYLRHIEKEILTLKLNLSLQNQTDCFISKSFDVVLLLDVVEHLHQNDAERLIDESERIARKKVIIYTPNGFLDQEGDAWRLDGDWWQKHRCFFTESQLKERGYRTKLFDEKSHNKQFKTILAVKNV